jgi:hypothetical protein
MRGTLSRHWGYLGRLVARMEALGRPADDRMRVEAVNARDAVEAMLRALREVEPAEPSAAVPPSRRPVHQAAPAGPTQSASLRWVGKRKAKRPAMMDMTRRRRGSGLLVGVRPPRLLLNGLHGLLQCPVISGGGFGACGRLQP